MSKMVEWFIRFFGGWMFLAIGAKTLVEIVETRADMLSGALVVVFCPAVCAVLWVKERK